MQTVAVVAADGDIFSTLTNLTNSSKTLLTAVGGLIAVLIVILAAWRTKGAMGGIVGGFVAAVLVVFFVNNADNSDVQDQIDKTVNNGSGPPATAPVTPGPLQQ